MCCPIFIIDLDKADFGKLLEIQGDKICDIEISSIGRAGSFQKNMRDAIPDFQPAIARESVIDGDPAKGESLGRAGTFEVFVEHGLRQGVGPCPAVTGDYEGWGIGFVTHPVHKIDIDQFILRRDCRPACMRRRERAGGRTRSRRHRRSGRRPCS